MTAYYVKNGGSNALNGQSDANAWATLAKVQSSAFSPGDTISFACGSEWREALTFPSAGSAASPIKLQAYGTGAKPIFNGGNIFTGWTVSGGGTNTLQVAATTQVRMASRNGIKLRLGASATTLNNDEFFWAANVLYIRDDSRTGAVPTGVVEGGVRDNGIWCETKADVTISSLQFRHYNGSAGRFRTNSNRIIIEDCDFWVCTSQAGGWNGVISFNNSDDCTERRNTYVGCDSDCVYGVNAQRPVSENSVVETTYGAASDCFQFDYTLTDDWNNANVVMRDLRSNATGTISTKGNGPIFGYGAVVEDCDFTGGRFGLSSAGSGHRRRRNIARNVTDLGGIRVANDDGAAIDDLLSEREIATKCQYGVLIDASGGDRTDHRFKNLNVYDASIRGFAAEQPLGGELTDSIIWCPSSSGAVLRVPSVHASNFTVKNCIIGPEKSGFIEWGGATYNTLAAWQAATGNGAGCLSVDPQWNNPDAENFTLKSTSPARGAGLVGGDMGAVEYSDPAAAAYPQTDFYPSPNVFPGQPLPSADITVAPTVTSISRVSGKDSTSFSFKSNQAYQAYQLRAVPGASSPVSAGDLIESGGGGAANTTRAVDVTDDELWAAGVTTDGTKIVKVFVQNIAGMWSADDASSPSFAALLTTHADILSLWKLGELSGSSAVDAVSGYTGTYNGAVVKNEPPLAVGEPDRSAYFDGGVTTYVAAPVDSVWSDTSFAVGALVKLDASVPAQHQPIFGVTNAAGSVRWTFVARRNSAGNKIAVWDSSNSWRESTVSLTADVVYHVLATFSGSTVTFYVNGVAAGVVTTGAVPTATDRAFIGTSFAGSNDRLKGHLGFVHFFDAPPSPEEIAAIADAAL